MRFLAWVLPGAGLLALVLGAAGAPDRERALAHVGFAALAVGGLGVGAFLLTRMALVACAERGMLPSLVAVNFYEIGDVLRVVEVLNGIDSAP